ncbi:MAG: class I SAM-dependent methyltransferase, partial [Chloroflexota bacterium]
MTTTDVVTTGQDFEYRGQMAATWDLFRGDTSNWEDRFFFLDVVRKYGQPTLDVGCGTGRLLLDFLSQGMDVDGVDISPEMLALCHQKAAKLGLKPNTFQQRMESLDLPRKYQTIIVPSSSFQLLTDPGLAAEAMGRFFAHLLPGGTLAMPFMNIWDEGSPTETEWAPRG